MAKTLIGPKLRKLRVSHKQTQAQMARALNVSPAYINLLENNQRSLSVQMLMAISQAYDIDLKELTSDDSAQKLSDLRTALSDAVFPEESPPLSDLRGAIDHAPQFVDQFLHLHAAHRSAMELITQSRSQGPEGDMLRKSPESILHNFFRDHANHFPTLEQAAEAARADIPAAPESLFVDLRAGLHEVFGITVEVLPIDEMGDSLRLWDRRAGIVRLSQALSSENRAFQLAHVMALVRNGPEIDAILGDELEDMPLLRVELANYFAAAFMMPYSDVLRVAQATGYDIDRIAAAFGVTFEQVCQRLTTLQSAEAPGVPFFFLRIDRAGNVTKRVNPMGAELADYGGACPVWNIHTAFYTPGVIMPQFVEMPDGQRFFTISRTVHRPVFSKETQDRRLTLALGCDAQYADQIGYASGYRSGLADLYQPIGLNCHLCPRTACSQRAHQPLIIDLPMDAARRGSTRYEN